MVFKLNYNQLGNRSGLEPSQVSHINVKISPKVFMNTLCHFIKVRPKKRGIDKNFWVKKFIKKVEYSKEEVAISLYYWENPGEETTAIDASGWVGAATGKDKNSCDPRGKPVCKNRSDSFESLEWLARVD